MCPVGALVPGTGAHLQTEESQLPWQLSGSCPGRKPSQRHPPLPAEQKIFHRLHPSNHLAPSQSRQWCPGPCLGAHPWGGCCAMCNQEVPNSLHPWSHSRAGTGTAVPARSGVVLTCWFLDAIPLRHNRWKCRARGTRSI